jgi:hypothetical protein
MPYPNRFTPEQDDKAPVLKAALWSKFKKGEFSDSRTPWHHMGTGEESGAIYTDLGRTLGLPYFANHPILTAETKRVNLIQFILISLPELKPLELKYYT